MSMEVASGFSPICSFCDSTDMSLVMDFGEVALAGAFLRSDQFELERTYPLRVYYCHDCFAVQVVDKVSQQTLFQDYFYFSSSIKTLRDHFEHYAAEVTARFLEPQTATVVEFGCNDGVLLRPLVNQGIRNVIGVDPASNVVASINDERVHVVNDFFNESVAKDLVTKFGPVDMVMANNVYAHIPDIQGLTRAVHSVLNEDGVFVFEVHYLGKVITEMQYDMIYHEHLYYYSLLSAMRHFDRYDMMIFDLKEVPIHAGSMRFYVCKKGSKHSAAVSPKVAEVMHDEANRGFDRYETFKDFSRQVAQHKVKLMNLLQSLRKAGHSIAGYGASGRANTLIQYCGIGSEHLDYMIDDAPAKIGFFTPGSHLEILPSSILNSTRAPDYLLVFAWSFFPEICRRNERYLSEGGRMILPLPAVSIFPP